MTDEEIVDWVAGLIAAVESEFAVDDHDMDQDNANLEKLIERLAVNDGGSASAAQEK